jgi:hypothetical protein
LRTLIFWASIAGNCALVTALLLRPPVRIDGSALEAPRASERPLTGDVTAELLRQELLAAGLSNDQTKPAVLASLQAERTRAARTNRYWSSDTTTMAPPGESNDAELRRKLIELYGVEAVDDPAFARVFRPYEARLPFLSSEQQLALQALRSRDQPGAASDASIPRLRISPPLQSSENELRAIFTDEASYREYSLRESPLAYQLRASGVAFTEDEYRTVFALIEDQRSNPSPTKFAERRREVQRALGAERSARLWAALDPSFGAIQAAAKKHALPDATVFTAFQLMLEAQDDMAAASATADVSRRASDFRNLISQRDRSLRELVGGAAAADLIGAQASFFQTLRGPSAGATPAYVIVPSGGQ